MSVVCQAFGCTPDIALQQDWLLVERVLDYRAAELAVETFNAKDRSSAFEQLRDNPFLLEMLAKMSRAQRGLPLHGADSEAEGMSVAKAYAPPEEPEE